MNKKTLVRFVADFVLAAGISTGGYLFGQSILNSDSDWAVGFFLAGLSLLPFAYFISYGAATFVMCVGIFLFRPGLIAGPVAFGVAVAVLTSQQAQVVESRQVDATARARALDQRAFQPMLGRYDVIAVDGEGDCREVCIAVLAKTGYAFASKDYRANGPYLLYRRAEGETCFAPENHQLTLAFLESGYAGVCATPEKWTPGKEGLFVLANENNYRRPSGIDVPGYSGYVFEARERRADGNRLLGRWLHGEVHAEKNTYSALSVKPVEEIGAPFEPEDFFAALLNAPLRRGDTTGMSPIGARLDGLLRLVDDPAWSESAMRAASLLVETSGRADPSAAMRVIERLLATGKDYETRTGLRLLSGFDQVPNLNFAKPAVLEALADHDPGHVVLALRAIHAFPADQRDFADPAIDRLIFDPPFPMHNSAVSGQLLQVLRDYPVPFPEDRRRRAEERLANAVALTEDEKAVLLLVIRRK